MIRCIVAIDSQRGMADDKGIPWHLPTDIKYFRDQTMSGSVLMGLVTYKEFEQPMQGRQNFVVNDTDEPIREGFNEVRNLIRFVQEFQDDLWIIGGAGVFAQTIELADELYLTRLDGEFGCTKLFPEFEQDFELATESEPHTENDITFRFQVWKRK